MPGSKNDLQTYPVLGLLAVKHSLIDRATMEQAVTSCSGTDDMEKALSDYLVNRALVSPLDMKRLQKAAKAVAMRKRDVKFGTIAIKKGYITPVLLEMALDEQRKELVVNKRSRLLGDILVEAGMLTSRQKDSILNEQNRLKNILSSQIADQDDDPLGLGPALDGSPDASEKETGEEEKTEKESMEIVAQGLTLQISPDRIAAFLIKTDTFDENMTSDDIHTILKERNICFGIVDTSLIDGFIRTSAFKTKPFRVALGKKAKPGKDADIRFYFNTDRLQAGAIDTSGAIDFKNRGDIPQVEAGVLLAEKIPMTERENGLTVFGEVIETKEVVDIVVQNDIGTQLSEDGLKVFSTIKGQPILSWAGAISVLDEYVTKGDVDYETGHLSFSGNIKVNGCIKAGFNVTGNTVVANEIDGGVIHAEGDVIIIGGINEATIYARGSVTAAFVLKSDIQCMGDVRIQKELVDSKVDTGGLLAINNGKIIASRVNANCGVFVKDIGTERSTPSTIKSGVNVFMLSELKLLEQKITKRKTFIRKIMLRQAHLNEAGTQLQEKTSQLAHLQDRGQLEIRELEQKISGRPDASEELSKRLEEMKTTIREAEKELDACFFTIDRNENRFERLNQGIAAQQEKVDLLVAEKTTLEDWHKNNPGTVIIEFRGSLMAGTTVAGRHSELTLERTIRNTTIKEMKFTKPGGETHAEWWEMRPVDG